MASSTPTRHPQIYSLNSHRAEHFGSQILPLQMHGKSCCILAFLRIETYVVSVVIFCGVVLLYNQRSSNDPTPRGTGTCTRISPLALVLLSACLHPSLSLSLSLSLIRLPHFLHTKVRAAAHRGHGQSHQPRSQRAHGEPRRSHHIHDVRRDSHACTGHNRCDCFDITAFDGRHTRCEPSATVTAGPRR